MMMMVNQVPNNNLKVDGGFVCKLIFEQLVRFDGSMSNIISTEFAHKQIGSFSPSTISNVSQLGLVVVG